MWCSIDRGDITRNTYLERYLDPFRDLLRRDDVVEIAINPDGKVRLEIASDAKARVSEKNPLVSGQPNTVALRMHPDRIIVTEMREYIRKSITLEVSAYLGLKKCTAIFSRPVFTDI
jgi:hypothetical protein